MPLDVAAAKQSCAAAGRPEATEPMIVLATGTGGFVGSATALVLKQRGHGVSAHRPAHPRHMHREPAQWPSVICPVVASPLQRSLTAYAVPRATPLRRLSLLVARSATGVQHCHVRAQACWASTTSTTTTR